MTEKLRTIGVKLGGFGGQGIILSGHIVGKAAAIYDNKFSCLIKSYGPEARGGACNTQVTVSRSQILYPYIIIPDILVVMSQEAYQKYGPEMNSESVLLYEKDLVTLNPEPKTDNIFPIPAQQIAEELGRKIVTNIVMLGFLGSTTGITSQKALQKAIEATVPKGTIDLNVRVYEQGYEYGVSLLAKHPDYLPPGQRLA